MAEVVTVRTNDRLTIGELLEGGCVKSEIGKVKERFECYAIALDKGFMSVDEVRRLEKLPERPKVNTIYP